MQDPALVISVVFRHLWLSCRFSLHVTAVAAQLSACLAYMWHQMRCAAQACEKGKPCEDTPCVKSSV